MERVGCVKWEGSALGLVSTNMQKQLILTSIQKLSNISLFYLENFSFSKLSQVVIAWYYYSKADTMMMA